MSPEEVFQFTEAKEAASRLSQSQGIDAALSQYQHTKQDEIKHRKDGDNNELCSYCNKRGHGKSAPTRIRWHDCPAYGTICDKCGQAAPLWRSKNKSTRLQKPTPPSGNTRKQKAPSLSHAALQPASLTSQAKESSHLTTTSTVTSLTTGSDSHPSPNHSSRLQQQPTLKTTQHWDTTPSPPQSQLTPVQLPAMADKNVHGKFRILSLESNYL